MDKHICLSHCRFSAFKQLAWNYLRISEHGLFGDDRKLIEQVEVTPAEVAGGLMRFKDPKASLECFIKFLENKVITALKYFIEAVRMNIILISLRTIICKIKMSFSQIGNCNVTGNICIRSSFG